MKRLSGSQEYSETGKFKLMVRQFEGPIALIKARSCALGMVWNGINGVNKNTSRTLEYRFGNALQARAYK